MADAKDDWLTSSYGGSPEDSLWQMDTELNEIYYGPISGTEAATILINYSLSTCHLLRFSKNHQFYCLSVRNDIGEVYHYELEVATNLKNEKYYHIKGSIKQFESLKHLLTYYSTNPLHSTVKTIGIPCIKHNYQIIKYITKAITSKQCLNRKVANIILQGLPESGKTSLLNRLLGQPPKDVNISTGIAEPLVTVEINPTTTLDAAYIESTCTWKIMNFDQSLISQLNIHQLPNEQPKTNPHGTKTASPSTGNTENNKISLKTANLDVEKTSDKLFSTLEDSINYNVRAIVNKYKIKKIGDLENSSSLYIRDVGGQIEFQESLSLLLYGPSIFLFVMKTNVDLHTKTTIQYRSPAGDITNAYKSSISTTDALLQLLTSISALQTTADQVIKSYKPIVFIVGTHIDQLGSEAQCAIDDLNKELDNIIRASEFMEFVQYANWKTKEVMYPVDNTATRKYRFEDLQIAISKHITERSEFTINYPISYLLFCLELNSEKRNVISMDTCRKLASKFKIHGDEVKSLLHFLHFRVGVIQHYDVDGLRDLVIKEPQVLFNSITNLIVKTFLPSGSLTTSEQENFCKKGIIDGTAFKYLLDREDEMTPEQFLSFLLHLRMAIPFTDKCGVKKYFLPSVLNHVKKSPSPEKTTNIATMFVTFQQGHSPKGLFGMLISHLMSPEQIYPLTFDLLEDNLYQDQVSFLVHSAEDVDEICLKMYVSHLEIQMFLQNSNTVHGIQNLPCAPRLTTPSNVCTTVRLILEHSLQQSLNSLHYDSQLIRPMLSLKCSHHDCGKFHQVKKGQTMYYLYCSTNNSKNPIQPSGQYWFNADEDVSPVNADQPGTPDTRTSTRMVQNTEEEGHKAIASTENVAGKSILENKEESQKQTASTTSATKTSEVPTFSIRTLTLLKWKVKTSGQNNSLRLRDEMSPKWEEVGDLLGLEPFHLMTIKTQQREDVRMCCREVLIAWISMDKGSYPASWGGLVCLLEDIQLNATAKKLQDALKHY